jgi:phage recombination protein Bet
MSAIATLPIPDEFTVDKIDLIRRTICKGATADELALFLHQCRKTGLDPLARQIYLVERSGKKTIQTGIDGYRLIADRTGKYAGNEDPVFDNEDNPQKATVTVYKLVAGVRCPFTATARWKQYYPGKGQGWAWDKMPHLMLGKCAEALALRKAFPAELSGVYTHEEMEQSGSAQVPTISDEVEKVSDEPSDTAAVNECLSLIGECKNRTELETVAAGFAANPKLTEGGKNHLRDEYKRRWKELPKAVPVNEDSEPDLPGGHLPPY